jgi:hypothetical protein
LRLSPPPQNGSSIRGIVFGQYLARFANNYVTMYAGLASVIIALVFLYFIAAIFVYGGELNAAIIKSRLPHGVSLQAAQSLKLKARGPTKQKKPSFRHERDNRAQNRAPWLTMFQVHWTTNRHRRLSPRPAFGGFQRYGRGYGLL